MSERAMVCSADRRASEAGLAMLREGGSAVDAALAANAVMAVVAPQQCGLGGDLFAAVHAGSGPPVVLNASGRSGSGADADALRAEGHEVMPARNDVRAVTVPGCVDGWLALHERFGRIPFGLLLEPAIGYAEKGFAASAGMVAAGATLGAWPTRVGERTSRPGIGRALRAVADAGRSAFYLGEFGEGLLALGQGLFVEEDLRRVNADWQQPLGVRVHGHDVWTAAPNSQGYVLALALAVSEAVGVPEVSGERWAHVLAESAMVSGQGRAGELHEHADGAALTDPERVRSLAAAVDPERHRPLEGTPTPGGTTCVTVVAPDGSGVSLLQSNANGLGSLLFEPSTGINLHNRGIGFSLAPGSPAAYGPGRRPPHTLVPVVVTRADGSLRAVLGSIGGDIQPQITLQLVTRILRHGASPRQALDAPRWRICTDLSLFETWSGRSPVHLGLETDEWADGLERRGHRVRVEGPDAEFGQAHVIDTEGGLRGAAEPRVPDALCAAY